MEDTPKNPSGFKPIPCEHFTTSVRGITPTTFNHWNYKRGEYDGQDAHVANIYQNGKIVAQKLRMKGKKFISRSAGKIPLLYGMWLWPTGGRKIVVTEGELDALSVSQIQGNKWPVVSLTNGAKSAVKAFKENIEYLSGFDQVVICFDADEPGQEAAHDAAQVLPPGKASIVQFPGDYKDANEMLVAGAGQSLQSLLWNAKPYRPDDIVTLTDVREKVLQPVEWGFSYPWEDLTAMTFGRRLHESTFVGAGTGIGKTTFICELLNHDANVLGIKTGMIPLEQTPHKFFQRLAGLLGNKKFHKPSDGSWDEQDLQAALQHINHENLFVYNTRGNADWDVIKAKIRYLAIGCGCQSIYLDNLTGITGGKSEGRMELIDRVTLDIASLVLELPIMITVVSHLATPEKGSHEEGARVQLKEFKGSRSIGAWAHNAIGLERDQQDPDRSDVMTVRFLKDREMGEAVGRTCDLQYDHSTGRLIPYNDPDLGDDDPF